MAIFEPLNTPHHWQPSRARRRTLRRAAGRGGRKPADGRDRGAGRSSGTGARRFRRRPGSCGRRRWRICARSFPSSPKAAASAWSTTRCGPWRGAALRHRAGDAVARTRGRNPGPCRHASRSRRSDAISAAHASRPPMAGPGSWTPWKRASATASPGSGSNHAIIEGAGPLSSVLGPADWTHGIARPLQNVVADPNPNLTVQLFRQPRGAMGRRPRPDAVAAGGRPRHRRRRVAGRPWRDRPGLDVGDPGAVSQSLADRPCRQPIRTRKRLKFLLLAHFLVSAGVVTGANGVQVNVT